MEWIRANAATLITTVIGWVGAIIMIVWLGGSQVATIEAAQEQMSATVARIETSVKEGLDKAETGRESLSAKVSEIATRLSIAETQVASLQSARVLDAQSIRDLQAITSRLEAVVERLDRKRR